MLYQDIGRTMLAFPGREIQAWVQEMEDPVKHTKAVQQYLTYRADLHDRIRQCSAERKEQEASRYNRGIK